MPEFLSKYGQLLLSMLDLMTTGERAIDEVMDVMGRATERELYWHGTQK